MLIENKLFLLGNKNVVISPEQNLSDYFVKHSLIYRETGSATRISMENFLKKTDIVPNMKIQLTSNEAVKQAVIAGLGLSVMPLIGLKNELENGDLRIIPVNKLPIVSNWRLIWLKGKKLSPVATAYLDFVTKYNDDIKNTYFAWVNNY